VSALRVQEFEMFHAYLVVVGSQAIGVIAQDSGGYRFFAIKNAFSPLEDERFDSAEKARSAALDFYRDADPPRSSPLSLATC